MKRVICLLVIMGLSISILYVSFDRLLIYFNSLKLVSPDKIPGEVRIDFNEYLGTMESLPDGMFVTGLNNKNITITEGYNPFRGLSILPANSKTSLLSSDNEKENSSFLGFGAFSNGNGEISFGIRERGETELRDARLFYKYTNNTENTIIGFTVSYDVETWFSGARDNCIRLKYHLEQEGFSNIEPIVTTYNPQRALHENSLDQKQTYLKDEKQAGIFLDGNASENRTTVKISFVISELPTDNITLGPLKPGESAYFRWQYSNGKLSEGRLRSALGINNIHIIPHHEDHEDHEETADTLTWSHAPGFYVDKDGPFKLSIQTSLQANNLAISETSLKKKSISPISLDNAYIYYTLDGSVPDPNYIMSDQEYSARPPETRQRTFIYEAPIDIKKQLIRKNDIALIPTNSEEGIREWNKPGNELAKGVVVRAKAVRGSNETTLRTKSFFSFPEGRERYSLPVVSLATDRKNLFDKGYGIYTAGEFENYNQRGIEWERPAYIELFDVYNIRPVSQLIGIRIHGSFTRTFPQKNIRLYSRSDYGTSRLNYPFFDTKDIDDYNRILLRNSGNDWGLALLSDAATQTLVAHLDFDTQHYQPAILFINGEYWGIHNFRDRYDRHYLETHYNVPRDEVVILEDDIEIDVGNPGDEQPYLDFLSALEAGHYTSWHEVDQIIALSGFVDYIAVQWYAGNTDWPHNNVRWWRYTGDKSETDDIFRDGRWRWLMYDMDYSFGYDIQPEVASVDMVSFTLEGFAPLYPRARLLIQSLMGIEEIRHELIQRLGVYLATLFQPAHVKEHLDEIVGGIEQEVAEHSQRWGRPLSYSNWQYWVSRMYKFALTREQDVKNHIIDYFPDVTGMSTLKITGFNDFIEKDNQSNQKRLYLHTLALCETSPGVSLIEGAWQGKLFQGISVEIRAAGINLQQIDISGGAESVAIHSDRVTFILTGDTEIALPSH